MSNSDAFAVEVTEQGLAQVLASTPLLRPPDEQVLCKHCGEIVCLIDRIGAESAHPFCRRAAAAT